MDPNELNGGELKPNVTRALLLLLDSNTKMTAITKIKALDLVIYSLQDTYSQVG